MPYVLRYLRLSTSPSLSDTPPQRFVSADAVSRLRAVYAGQWALEREGEVAEVVRRAIEHPDDYVLKVKMWGIRVLHVAYGAMGCGFMLHV